MNGITKWFIQLGKAFRQEMSTVIHDAGVLLFFIGLPVLYPLVYTAIYNPEEVREIPFAVVDHCRSAESRRLVRQADATSAMKLYDYAPDMQSARALMAEGKVYGIMEIPSDYSKCIMTGRQATVPFYAEMSLLLRYRAFLSALTDLQLHITQEVTAGRLASAGAAAPPISGLPINTQANILGDTQQGFASFIMPGIVVLILQQSMVLGICLVGGTAAERRRRNAPLAYSSDMASHGPMATILGKALCYVVFYIPVTIYILHYITTWFDLPHIGNPADYLLLMLPFLLASAFFGIMLGNLMRQREDAFIYIVFTSVVFLFLSGLTWPRFAMPGLWHALAGAIPATWGVEGFIRINSNGATLAESSEPFLWLWGLAAAYLAACYAIARITAKGRRANRSH